MKKLLLATLFVGAAMAMDVSSPAAYETKFFNMTAKTLRVRLKVLIELADGSVKKGSVKAEVAPDKEILFDLTKATRWERGTTPDTHKPSKGCKVCAKPIVEKGQAVKQITITKVVARELGYTKGSGLLHYRIKTVKENLPDWQHVRAFFATVVVAEGGARLRLFIPGELSKKVCEPAC